jgi:4,4'-diaponeurosporenoate glycosyltransferase
MLPPDLLLPLALLGIGFFLLWRVPSLGGIEPETGEGPRISVIVPARNEAQRIGPLLCSLLEQTCPPHEVIVVDDQSTDDTAGIARNLGAKVITGKPLPDEWAGKPWACWQGASRASGELLAFLDADTWLTNDGLARLVTAYHGGREADRGLLTVQPYHVTRKPYEALSAFFNIVLMAGLNAFTPWGSRLPPSGAFGPCMVCSKSDYDRVEGHRQGRSAVLEGFPLTRAFHDHGLPVRCYGGKGGLAFRMYPDGVKALIEGWSKGFGTGALAIRPLFLLLCVAWVWGCFDVTIAFAKALVVQGQPVQAAGLAPYAALYTLYALQIHGMLRRIGAFPWWTAPLFPIPALTFALVMLRSFVLIHLLGRVTWKGRHVVTREPKR